MFLYFLAFVISLVICFFLYIKIKYRFWALQPVFHFYDIYYWIFNIGIIRHELPKKNKYVNLKNIEFNKIDNLLEKNNKQMKQFTFLLQTHYLQNKENIFHPEWINISPYFIVHKYPCFISFYYEKMFLEDIKNNNTVEDKKMIGCITSRPLQIYIQKNKKYEEFYLYYVDYLCVNKNYRKKNVAPQLIQTHEYLQSHSNKEICVNLFKREGELTGIIPLCCYTTYCFNMSKWNVPSALPLHMNIIDSDSQNIFYVWSFIKETTIWKVIILPEISNIIELIKTQNIFLKILIIEQEIKAIYFFRKVCTSISTGKYVISCFASMKGNISDELFIHAFKISVNSIVNAHKFYYLSIEKISHNDILIENLLRKSNPEITSPTAYFFYNFAYQSFPSNKVLIIN